MQLWETSGHAANYRENMFLLEVIFFLFLRVHLFSIALGCLNAHWFLPHFKDQLYLLIPCISAYYAHMCEYL